MVALTYTSKISDWISIQNYIFNNYKIYEIMEVINVKKKI